MANSNGNRTEPNSDKASFVIQIKCMQNYTWQGTIQWLEGKKTQNFRSALELIKLMDNALGEPDQPNQA